MRVYVTGSLMILCTACQTYVATTFQRVVPGDDVRLTLAEGRITQLTSVLGPNLSGVEGVVVSRDTDGIQVKIREILRPGEVSSLGHGELVRISIDAVTVVQAKQLSKARSLLTAGAVVIGAALITRSSGEPTIASQNGGGSVATK